MKTKPEHKITLSDFFDLQALSFRAGAKLIGQHKSFAREGDSTDKVFSEDDLVEFFSNYNNVSTYSDLLVWMFLSGAGPYIRDKEAEDKLMELKNQASFKSRRKLTRDFSSRKLTDPAFKPAKQKNKTTLPYGPLSTFTTLFLGVPVERNNEYSKSSKHKEKVKTIEVLGTAKGDSYARYFTKDLRSILEEILDGKLTMLSVVEGGIVIKGKQQSYPKDRVHGKHEDDENNRYYFISIEDKDILKKLSKYHSFQDKAGSFGSMPQLSSRSSSPTTDFQDEPSLFSFASEAEGSEHDDPVHRVDDDLSDLFPDSHSPKSARKHLVGPSKVSDIIYASEINTATKELRKLIEQDTAILQNTECQIYHFISDKDFYKDNNLVEYNGVNFYKVPLYAVCDEDGRYMIGDDDSALCQLPNKLPQSINSLFNYGCFLEFQRSYVKDNSKKLERDELNFSSEIKYLILKLRELSINCVENKKLLEDPNVAAFIKFFPNNKDDSLKNIFDFAIRLLKKRIKQDVDCDFLKQLGSMTIGELVLKFVIDDKIGEGRSPLFLHGSDPFNPNYDAEARVSLGEHVLDTEQFLLHMLDRLKSDIYFSYNDHPVRFHSDNIDGMPAPKVEGKKIYSAERRELAEISIINRLLALIEDHKKNKNNNIVITKEFGDFCDMLIHNQEIHMEFCEQFHRKASTEPAKKALIDAANKEHLRFLNELKNTYTALLSSNIRSAKLPDRLKTMKQEKIEKVRKVLQETSHYHDSPKDSLHS